MTKREPKILYVSARAYSVALMIEKYAAKYDRGTPLQIAHEQIKAAHKAGCEEGRELMLEVYPLLVARHHVDDDIRIVWLDDDEGEGNEGGDE
jgi:hypothetical protein